MSNKSLWRNPRYSSGDAAGEVSASLQLGEKLKLKTKDGWALGTFLIDLPCHSTVMSLALSGFDFLVLDMEHSSIDFSKLESLIAAANAAKLPVLVRVWGEDVGLIGKVLDMGANGIMVPHVASAKRTKEVIEQAYFPPKGLRGFSPISKFDSLEYPLKQLNDSVYVVVQVEGAEAIDQIDEIAAVTGIDAIFIGPYDLALSLGVSPGSSEVFEAAEQLAKRVPANVDLGIYIDDPSQCGAWKQKRFSLQCVGFDSRMLSVGAELLIAKARESNGSTNKNVEKE